MNWRRIKRAWSGVPSEQRSSIGVFFGFLALVVFIGIIATLTSRPNPGVTSDQREYNSKMRVYLACGSKAGQIVKRHLAWCARALRAIRK